MGYPNNVRKVMNVQIGTRFYNSERVSTLNNDSVLEWWKDDVSHKDKFGLERKSQVLSTSKYIDSGLRMSLMRGPWDIHTYAPFHFTLSLHSLCILNYVRCSVGCSYCN